MIQSLNLKVIGEHTLHCAGCERTIEFTLSRLPGVFSFTMGALMLVVSGLVAASHQTLINRLKAATPKIKMASAIVLILVGLFNLYSVFNLEQFVRLLFP